MHAGGPDSSPPACAADTLPMESFSPALKWSFVVVVFNGGSLLVAYPVCDVFFKDHDSGRVYV